MQRREQVVLAALATVLALSTALACAEQSHATEVQLNGLTYYGEASEWFVVHGGDTFRVAPAMIAVRFREDAGAATIDSLLTGIGSVRRVDRRGFHYVRLSTPPDILTVVSALRSRPRVLVAETGFGIKFLATPDDDDFGAQWYLHNSGTVLGDTSATADADIDAPEAWEIETGDTTAVIAVIDTGIDRYHSDLSLCIWRNWDDPSGGGDADSNGYADDFWGWDFEDGDSNTIPPNGGQESHGTWVAGVAGAVSNNSTGIAGAAGGWGTTPRRSCLLMPVRCGVDTADSLDISAAIDYAADNGARVINMSWATGPSQHVAESLADAYDDGVLLVAATGPRGASWPATYADVMGVAATDWDDSWSETGGAGGEIWAPGAGSDTSSIYTTDYTGGGPNQDEEYRYVYGTSFAAPQVSAIGGLLFSKHPGLTAPECRQLILAGADSLGTIGTQTVLRANARGALTALCSETRIDPHLSSVTLSDSTCVVLCPAADLDSLVVNICLRTGCGDAISGVAADSITVTLIRDVTNNFKLCCGSSEYTAAADAATDTTGCTTATIRAGAGVDDNIGVRVTALGVELDDRPTADLRSVAYDGTCTVPRPQAGQVPDLDCDGTAGGTGDTALVETHYGHTCP